MDYNHLGARNWPEPPASYYESRLAPVYPCHNRAPCCPFQRLPTSDLTCHLRSRISEYVDQYCTLKPIILPDRYACVERTEKANCCRTCCKCQGNKCGEKPCCEGLREHIAGKCSTCRPKDLDWIGELMKMHSCNDVCKCKRFEPPEAEADCTWLKVRKGIQDLRCCKTLPWNGCCSTCTKKSCCCKPGTEHARRAAKETGCSKCSTLTKGGAGDNKTVASCNRGPFGEGSRRCIKGLVTGKTVNVAGPEGRDWVGFRSKKANPNPDSCC